MTIFVTQNLETEKEAWTSINCNEKSLLYIKKRENKNWRANFTASLHCFIPILCFVHLHLINLFFIQMLSLCSVNIWFTSWHGIMISQKRQLCLLPLLTSNQMFPLAFLPLREGKCLYSWVLSWIEMYLDISFYINFNLDSFPSPVHHEWEMWHKGKNK